MKADHTSRAVLLQPNINFLWAALLVEELRRQGVDHFFLSPGSRSAPLLFTIAEDQRLSSTVHFDERALAFMACGYAAASGKPAALVCTSGTAVANFLPAVIEASKKKLPLIVITADRPPELQKCGAPQCIEQPGLFRGYARWDFDLPCPTMDIVPQFVLTTAAQAVSRAKGEVPGPVHLNFMFREPLAPLKQDKGLSRYAASLKAWSDSADPYTTYTPRISGASADTLREAARRIGQFKNGLILAGKLSTPADRLAVLSFAEMTGFPVFADITSGLRLGVAHPHVISFFDRVLHKDHHGVDFDGVIHFGGRMTSKRCYEALKPMKLKDYLMVLAHPLRSDPLHLVSMRYPLTPAVFIRDLLPLIERKAPTLSLRKLRASSRRADQEIVKSLNSRNLSEPGIARAVTELIPSGQGLFLSNSMPVRDVDVFASSEGQEPVIGTNRGASGIDGIIASAIGFAEGLQRTTTLIIGDLAFLYDLNALAMLKKSRQKLIIVAINNDGGGIFSLLPVKTGSQAFTKCFTAPHGIGFHYAARLFNVKYSAPGSMSAFKNAYRSALRTPGSTLIEIKVARR